MAIIRRAIGKFRRMLRRPFLVRPSLVIIGAQKAGTTSLAFYLPQHPQVVTSGSKEIDYFASDPRYAQGEGFYHQHFGFTPNDHGKLSFDASPHYLLSREAPNRIYEYNPNCRLICLLREPVSRAFSAFQMYRKLIQNNRQIFDEWNARCYTLEQRQRFLQRPESHQHDFELAAREEIAAYHRGEQFEWHVLQYGLYAENLTPYLQAFPQQQILILDSATFERETAKSMTLVTEFLGLAPVDWNLADTRKHHVGGYKEAMSPAARELISEFYQSPNRQLKELLPNVALSWL